MNTIIKISSDIITNTVTLKDGREIHHPTWEASFKYRDFLIELTVRHEIFFDWSTVRIKAHSTKTKQEVSELVVPAGPEAEISWNNEDSDAVRKLSKRFFSKIAEAIKLAESVPDGVEEPFDTLERLFLVESLTRFINEELMEFCHRLLYYIEYKENKTNYRESDSIYDFCANWIEKTAKKKQQIEDHLKFIEDQVNSAVI